MLIPHYGKMARCAAAKFTIRKNVISYCGKMPQVLDFLEFNLVSYIRHKSSQAKATALRWGCDFSSSAFAEHPFSPAHGVAPCRTPPASSKLTP